MNVIVIGGGVMGLSCAYRLACAGAHVRLFEARECGQGATHAALGVLRPASPFASSPLQLFHQAAINEFEPFIAELQHELGLRLRFRRMGYLDLLHSDHSHRRTLARVAEANRIWPPMPDGSPIQEILSPAQMRAQFPSVAPTSHGALLCRSTAHIDPADLITSLKTLCLRRNVDIYEHTGVQSLEQNKDRITRIHTADSFYDADAVLLTAGPWIPQIAPHAKIPLTPAKGQAIAVPPLPLPHIIKSRTTYLVPTPDELLIGSTTEPEAGFDESPTPAAAESLRAAAAKIIPALAAVPILRHWVGLRADAPDHLPMMGPHPAFTNLYICAGHYKTGITTAPLASKLLADAILTQRISDALLPFLPPADSSVLTDNTPPRHP